MKFTDHNNNYTAGSGLNTKHIDTTRFSRGALRQIDLSAQTRDLARSAKEVLTNCWEVQLVQI